MSNFILPEPVADPLLALIGRYRTDTRTNKIDLGVGVYRDNHGDTPVLSAVKTAELQLHQQQQSKSYLGLTGDIGFVEAYGDLIFEGNSRNIAGAQAPGGSGALRLAAEVFKTAYPGGTLWIGLPTWPNHLPLTESAGVQTKTFPYFSRDKQQIQFDQMLECLTAAKAGDGVLLHGCCHNPTGADLSPGQWLSIAQLIAQKELLPIIDLAYHGLGRGMNEDLAATRLMAEHNPQTLIAASCSKNFGLYRDRVGAVYMASDNKDVANRTQDFFGQVARRIYSMPPDHGAAVVRIILTDASLLAQWQTELSTMVDRVNSLRLEISKQGKSLNLGFVADQRGMFSLLPLDPAQVDSLIDDHAVYLAGDGRINIAGCQTDQVPRFIEALDAVGFKGIV